MWAPYSLSISMRSAEVTVGLWAGTGAVVVPFLPPLEMAAVLLEIAVGDIACYVSWWW